MPNIPCPTKIFGCRCDDYPVENYSAEDPDIPQFCANAFVGAPPPLGQGSGCGVETLINGYARACSPLSYADALLAAQQTAQSAMVSTWRDQNCVQIPQVCNTEQSCTVTCPDGTTVTYTVDAGLICADSQAAADAQAASYACQRANAALICLSDLPSYCCLDEIYIGQIIASGPGVTVLPGTNFWEIISGSLPAGLTFNGGHLLGSSATITGVPTSILPTTFTVKVTNLSGLSAQKTYTLGASSVDWTGATPPYSALPDGSVGTLYNITFDFPAVLPSAAVWSLTSGALPPGLSLNPLTGQLTGTPTSSGTFSFTIKLVSA